MKTLTRAALAGTAVTAALFAGIGPASAATVGAAGSAVAGVPTAANQLCGSTFVGPDNHVGGPSATSRAVSGVGITGKLYTASGSLVTTMSTTSNSDGSWCITGTSTMPAVVTFGGYVEMSATPTTVSDGTNTYTGQWSNAGGDAVLDSSEFYQHGYATPSITADRAWHVNFIYS